MFSRRKGIISTACQEAVHFGMQCLMAGGWSGLPSCSTAPAGSRNSRNSLRLTPPAPQSGSSPAKGIPHGSKSNSVQRQRLVRDWPVPLDRCSNRRTRFCQARDSARLRITGKPFWIWPRSTGPVQARLPLLGSMPLAARPPPAASPRKPRPSTSPPKGLGPSCRAVGPVAAPPSGPNVHPPPPSRVATPPPAGPERRRPSRLGSLGPKPPEPHRARNSLGPLPGTTVRVLDAG
jgi:hypothetical protein